MSLVYTADRNIDWLRERLYECKRECEAVGIINPTFVLLTKNSDERRLVENKIISHFAEKYGMDFFKASKFDIGFDSSRIGRFSFPDIGVQVVLMEIER